MPNGIPQPLIYDGFTESNVRLLFTVAKATRSVGCDLYKVEILQADEGPLRTMANSIMSKVRFEFEKEIQSFLEIRADNLATKVLG